MTEELEVVARCLKCGREFLTLPIYMADQYPPRGSRPDASGNWDICGGTVAMLSAQDKPGAER